MNRKTSDESRDDAEKRPRALIVVSDLGIAVVKFFITATAAATVTVIAVTATVIAAIAAVIVAMVVIAVMPAMPVVVVIVAMPVKPVVVVTAVIVVIVVMPATVAIAVAVAVIVDFCGCCESWHSFQSACSRGKNSFPSKNSGYTFRNSV